VRAWPRTRLGLLLRPRGWQVSIWPFSHFYVARTDGENLLIVYKRSKVT
jgi:hypothetical protein